MWVVLGHALAALPELPKLKPNLHNSSAVEIFIVISGFAISALLSSSSVSYWRYLAARAFRIFPIYWVCLAFSALLLTFAQEALLLNPPGFATEGRLAVLAEGKARFWTHLAVHVPLAQGLVPESVLQYAHVTILGQAWSLSLEWQFYLLAPMLIFFASNLARWSSRIGLGVSFLLLVVLGRKLNTSFLGNSLLPFAVGIASYKVLSVWRGRVSSRQIVPISAFLIAIATYALPEYRLAIAVWVCVLASIMETSSKGILGVPSKILRGKFVAYLGRISYPLYLIHMVALFMCLRVMPSLEIPPAARYVVLPLACLALSIIFSDLLNRLIEKPFHDVGRAISGAAQSNGRAFPSVSGRGPRALG